MALNDKLGEEDVELFDSEITLFIVSPELKGKGLGRKLMDRYVHFCKANGIATAFLWTDVDCDYSFYQKSGFKIHNTFKSAKQHRDAEHEDGMNRPSIKRLVDNGEDDKKAARD
ncbi:GNAT family N-acetyltransferase [Photobacterium sanguinicancri]|uniref:GNAT family N-acetyltransferase n=1 Tax=Photobacterium sanguinicancri TaxID=875932 RepID=UPI00167108D1|nr:GNAT family N-acetyltransferase [Photobacterium sanguinicancri]